VRITEEELIWAAARMLAYTLGGLLLCGITIKERIKAPR
jgi:hypothetical protein